jgi:hypothetical protein
MEVRRGEVEVDVDFTPDADFDPMNPSAVVVSGADDQ